MSMLKAATKEEGGAGKGLRGKKEMRACSVSQDTG